MGWEFLLYLVFFHHHDFQAKYILQNELSFSIAILNDGEETIICYKSYMHV